MPRTPNLNDILSELNNILTENNDDEWLDLDETAIIKGDNIPTQMSVTNEPLQIDSEDLWELDDTRGELQPATKMPITYTPDLTSAPTTPNDMLSDVKRIVRGADEQAHEEWQRASRGENETGVPPIDHIISGLGNVARGVARIPDDWKRGTAQAVGGALQSVFSAIPTVAAVETISPIVSSIAKKATKELGGGKKAQEVAGKVTELLTSVAGFGILPTLLLEGAGFATEEIAKSDLFNETFKTDEDKELALGIISPALSILAIGGGEKLAHGIKDKAFKPKIESDATKEAGEDIARFFARGEGEGNGRPPEPPSGSAPIEARQPTEFESRQAKGYLEEEQIDALQNYATERRNAERTEAKETPEKQVNLVDKEIDSNPIIQRLKEKAQEDKRYKNALDAYTDYLLYKKGALEVSEQGAKELERIAKDIENSFAPKQTKRPKPRRKGGVAPAEVEWKGVIIPRKTFDNLGKELKERIASEKAPETKQRLQDDYRWRLIRKERPDLPSKKIDALIGFERAKRKADNARTEQEYNEAIAEVREYERILRGEKPEQSKPDSPKAKKIEVVEEKTTPKERIKPKPKQEQEVRDAQSEQKASELYANVRKPKGKGESNVEMPAEESGEGVRKGGQETAVENPVPRETKQSEPKPTTEKKPTPKVKEPYEMTRGEFKENRPTIPITYNAEYKGQDMDWTEQKTGSVIIKKGEKIWHASRDDLKGFYPKETSFYYDKPYGNSGDYVFEFTAKKDIRADRYGNEVRVNLEDYINDFDIKKIGSAQSERVYDDKGRVKYRRVRVVEVPEHKRAVEQALKDGKEVPEEVLEEYPDLKKKYSEAEGKEKKPKEARSKVLDAEARDKLITEKNLKRLKEEYRNIGKIADDKIIFLAQNKKTLDEIFNLRDVARDKETFGPSERANATKRAKKLAREVPFLRYDNGKIYFDGVKLSRKGGYEKDDLEVYKGYKPKHNDEEIYALASMFSRDANIFPMGFGVKKVEKGLDDIYNGRESLEADVIRAVIDEQLSELDRVGEIEVPFYGSHYERFTKKDLEDVIKSNRGYKERGDVDELPKYAFQKKGEQKSKPFDLDKDAKKVNELLGDDFNVEFADKLTDGKGEPVNAMIDTKTNKIIINKRLANETTVLHEIAHGATKLIIAKYPKRAGKLLKLNGWDGKGDPMDFTNPTAVEAWENIAEKAEAYIKDPRWFNKNVEKPVLHKWFFEKMKQVWEALRNFAQGKGWISEAKFYDDLLNGKFKSRGAVVAFLPKEYSTEAFQINAYHGSGKFFDKFSKDEIGTGEGAQSYGYGLYFTSSKDVAKWYANKLRSLGEDVEYRVKDKDITKGDVSGLELLARIFPGGILKWDAPGYIKDKKKLHAIAKAVLRAREKYSKQPYPFSDKSLAAKRYWWAIKELGEGYIPEDKLRLIADAKIDEIKARDEVTDRALYEVEIHKGKSPDEYDYLDYDNYVSKKQIEKILKGIESEDAFKGVPKRPYRYGLYDNSLKFKDIAEWLSRGGVTGKEVYNTLAGWLGSKKLASEFLLKNGIDGIKYIGGESGQTNYVVFDDRVINIKNRTLYQRKKRDVSIEVLQTLDEVKKRLELDLAKAKSKKKPEVKAKWEMKAYKDAIVKHIQETTPPIRLKNTELKRLLSEVKKADNLNKLHDALIKVDVKLDKLEARSNVKKIYKIIKDNKPKPTKSNVLKGKSTASGFFEFVNNVLLDKNFIKRVREYEEREGVTYVPEDFTEEQLGVYFALRDLKNKDARTTRAVLEQIENIAKTGKAEFKELVEKQKKEREELANLLIEDMGLDKDNIPENERIAKRLGLKKRHFRPINDLSSFGSMIDYIVGKGVMGGKFSQWYHETVMKKHNEYFKKSREMQSEIEQAEREIFGKHFEAVIKKDSAEEDTGIILKRKNGQEEPLTTSKNVLAKRLMEWEDPDGRRHLEKMGYTEEIIGKIRDYVGEKWIRYAQWRREFEDKYFDEYDKAYREIFFTPAPRIKNHSRLYVEDIMKDEQDFFQSNKPLKGLTPSSAHLRTRRTKELMEVPLTLDVRVQAEEHAKFVTTTKFYRDLAGILRHENLKKAINSVYGKDSRIYHTLEALLRSDIENKEYLELETQRLVNFIVRNLYRAYLFSPKMIHKQFTSIMAYGVGVPPVKLVKGLAEFNKQPVRNSKFIWDNMPSVRERWQRGFDSFLADAQKKHKGDLTVFEQKLMKMSPESALHYYLRYGDEAKNSFLVFTKVGDIAPIFAGSYASYRYFKEKFLAQGLNELEAEEKALAFAEVLTNKTQQTPVGEFRSKIERHKLLKPFSMFTQSSILYFQSLVSVVHNDGFMKHKGLIVRTLGSILAAQAFYAVVSDPKSAEDPKRLSVNTLKAMMNYPIINMFTNVGANYLLGDRVYPPTPPIASPAYDAARFKSVMPLLNYLGIPQNSWRRWYKYNKNLTLGKFMQEPVEWSMRLTGYNPKSIPDFIKNKENDEEFLKSLE